MALGNWTGWVVTFPSGKVEGNLAQIQTSEGVIVQSYKNWLYLASQKFGTESFAPGVGGEFWGGAAQVYDACLLAARGHDEEIYFLAWEHGSVTGQQPICMAGIGCRNTDTGWPRAAHHARLRGHIWDWLKGPQDWPDLWTLPRTQLLEVLYLSDQALKRAARAHLEDK